MESGLLRGLDPELQHAASGVIQGLSLPTLLQMLNMEQKTCTIRVTSGRRTGFFYLLEGQIINARYRRAEGMEAVQLLIGAASPKMEIDSRLHDTAQRIDLRLEEILMQAAQFQDESAPETLKDGNPPEGSDAIPALEIGKWDPSPAPSPAPRARRPLGLLLGVLSCLLLAGGGGWWWHSRPVEVDIRSSPAGAAVSLDGVSQGTTPLRLKRPRPLQGTLSIALPGHQGQARTLRPEDRDLDFALAALPPPAAVEAPPPPAPPLREPPPRTKAKPHPKAQAPAKSDIFDQLRKPKE